MFLNPVSLREGRERDIFLFAFDAEKKCLSFFDPLRGCSPVKKGSQWERALTILFLSLF
jgi:hypothetical protein